MEKGYADGRVTGEGTIEDTLASIPYRKNASCLEVYVRDCEDADEAYDKIMNVTDVNIHQSQTENTHCNIIDIWVWP